MVNNPDPGRPPARQSNMGSTWLIAIIVVLLAAVAYYIFGPKTGEAPAPAEPPAASTPAPAPEPAPAPSTTAPAPAEPAPSGGGTTAPAPSGG
ncbi:hypothetical protein [Aminobacter sp. Piv2-1]|uniref:hypothetical protein n=1 Tax=Aminobacter sp. Piv2-1 TaxID=3031122 RepID=UPI0030A09431